VEPVARVLKDLGSEAVWVVHGSDGLDEITTAGPTAVAELKDGAIRTFQITPEDAGVGSHPKGAVTGGTAEENAAALRALLDGAPGAYRDTVLMNAGAALLVAGKAASLKEGASLAARSIDGGAARGVLDALVRISNEPVPA